VPLATFATSSATTSRADAEGLMELRPREDWKPYMRAVVPLAGGHERKTGVNRADVATVQLIQDERGWLRLAG